MCRVSYREQTHDDFNCQAPVNLGPSVNSSADDSGPTYFENDEGAPQLYFGSSSLGGLGGADIYMSPLLPDRSFGEAIAITELSSPSNENRAAPA